MPLWPHLLGPNLFSYYTLWSKVLLAAGLASYAYKKFTLLWILCFLTVAVKQALNTRTEILDVIPVYRIHHIKSQLGRSAGLSNNRPDGQRFKLAQRREVGVFNWVYLCVSFAQWWFACTLQTVSKCRWKNAYGCTSVRCTVGMHRFLSFLS